MDPMNSPTFAALAVLISAIPVLMAARRNRIFLVVGLILFGPHTASLVALQNRLVAALPGAGAWVQAALLLMHACFAGFIVFHFLQRHKPTRWELLYVVPGQFLFVGLFFYSFFYLAGLTGASVFQQVSIAAGFPFSAAGLALMFTHQTRQVELPVVVEGLTQPIRLLQLSDIHVGTFMGDWRLQRIARRINRVKPDMIVATGDFLTTRSEADYSPLLRFFQALERPPLGMYGCLGNHDLSVGRALCRDLEAVGVRMLVDEAETVTLPSGDRLRIAGLHFYWRQKAKNYHAAFEKCAGGSTEPVLLLCHDPAAFDLLPEAWSGVMLAGHLHGGQFGLTSLGINVSVLTPFGMYDQGLFRRGASQLYAHRGTGVYGFPVRIGVPAEVALITLQPAMVAAGRALITQLD
jgi:predicted MPP superfamily phosphohydrolase